MSFFPVAVILFGDCPYGIPKDSLDLIGITLILVRNVPQSVPAHESVLHVLCCGIEVAVLNQPIQIDVGADHILMNASAATGFQLSVCFISECGILFASLLDQLSDHALFSQRQISQFIIAHSQPSLAVLIVFCR